MLIFDLSKKRYIGFGLSLGCLIGIFYMLRFRKVPIFEAALWVRIVIVVCFVNIMLIPVISFYRHYFKQGESKETAFRRSVTIFADAMHGSVIMLLNIMLWVFLHQKPSLFWSIYSIGCFVYSLSFSQKSPLTLIEYLFLSLFLTPLGCKYVERQYIQHYAKKETGVKECIERADVYLNQMVQKDYASALAEYGQAIQIDPNRSDLYSQRAAIYYEQGDCINAITDFGTAIALEPRNDFLYLRRAKIYFEQGNYAEVISDCTRALQYPPEHAEFYRLRAIAYRKQGEYEKAIEDCKHVMEINPQDGGVYYSLAEVYALQNDYVNAFVNYSKAIDCNSSNPLYYKKRALAYEKLGNLEKAKADWDKAEEELYQEFLRRNHKSSLPTKFRR